MAYSSGMLKYEIVVQNRATAQDGKFGRNSAGVKYDDVCTIHAAVDWTRGVKAMREGALDAYDVVMVRCRWTSELTRESRIKYDGKVYQIDSFHADKEANTIQCTCTELTNG